MNDNLEKVAEIIKKSLKTKAQIDCFDGGKLYVEAYCNEAIETYQKNIELKFIEIDKKLTVILGVIGTNGGVKNG